MSTVEEIKLSDKKIIDSIDKQHAFEAQYPDTQAKAEASEIKADFTKAAKKPLPQIKMYEIEDSDIYKGTALAYSDGYKKKTLQTRKTVGWDSKMEMGHDSVKGIKIDYETINKEKRRYTSGYGGFASEEEFLRLPSANKMNLAGFREPFLIKPAPDTLYGNLCYADSNAVAGYDRKF